MRGLGTIVNVLAVIFGGLLGVLIKNGLKQRFQDILMQGCGIATIFIGAAGALSGFLVIHNGTIETQNTMLLVFSMVFGGLIGEILNIEKRMENLGHHLKTLLHNEKDTKFVEGFVSSSLVICVGAMAIVGSLQDGISGDASMLMSKAILDFIIVMVFASTLGIGAMFSFIPLGIYQGSITLLAVFISNYMTNELIQTMSAIGSVLIFCVGINITFGNKIKVGNLLPAILIPIIYMLL